MIYLWRTPQHYSERLVGVYKHELSPNRHLFTDGKRITEPLEKTPVISVKGKITEMQKYDCINFNACFPLVNEKVRGIFEWICPNDVQFFKAIVECKDGVLENYQIVNITHTTPATDLELSEYTLLKNTQHILGFKHLVFNQNCLARTGGEIARDKIYPVYIIVSEKIVTAFKGHRISGVEFVTDEEYNYRLAQIYGRG